MSYSDEAMRAEWESGRVGRLRILRGLLGLYSLGFPAVIVFNLARSTEDSAEASDGFVAEWEADDPRLAAHIRAHYATPPATLPYRLAQPHRRDFSQHGQPPIVHRLLGNKTGGVFLEAGALDGESYSNSLYLEREFGWTGLLVEPNPTAFRSIAFKRRRSWSVLGCLHKGRRPVRARMLSHAETGRLGEYSDPVFEALSLLRRPIHASWVWCWPVPAVLAATNITVIDYLAIDTEGSEMAILEAFPWASVPVSLLQVEFAVFNGGGWDKDATRRRKAAMTTLMARLEPRLRPRGVVRLDLLFQAQPSRPPSQLDPK